MDITLTLNERDFSARVSTYEVVKILEVVKTVTTMAGTEHTIKRTRDQIVFTLIPYDESTATADFNALKALEFIATYTDPNSGSAATKTVRVASDLDSVFGLKSVNNLRYYKGGKIKLRAVEVNTA